MLARYEGAYAATTLIVMGDRSGFAWKDVPEYNFIDELVYEKLQAGQGAAERPVHRRRVHPPRLPRPDRPAADARSRCGPSWPTRGRSKVKRDELIDKLVGSPRVRRALDEQVGRPAAGEPQVPGRAGAAALPQVDPQGRRRQHALRQVRLRHPDGQRLERREPAGRLLQGAPRRPTRRWRTRRSCSWPCASTATSATTIRSSAGRRTSTTSWPRTSPRSAATEDPKFKGQKIGGTAVEGAKPLVEVIADIKSGEVKHAAHRRRCATPTFPYTHDDLAAADGQPPRAAGEVDHRRRRTRTSPRATSTACGATCSASASSSRSTTSAPATRRPTRSCSTG